MLQNLLGKEYNILTAKDGNEALELVQNHECPESIQLIITDQRMPKMTGTAFLEKVRPIIPKTIRIHPRCALHEKLAARMLRFLEGVDWSQKGNREASRDPHPATEREMRRYSSQWGSRRLQCSRRKRHVRE